MGSPARAPLVFGRSVLGNHSMKFKNLKIFWKVYVSTISIPKIIAFSLLVFPVAKFSKKEFIFVRFLSSPGVTHDAAAAAKVIADAAAAAAKMA